MSSSDAQPPLSRRELRERERAAGGGAQQPATPAPSVPVASATDADSFRRRPGSHVAPAAAGAAQSSVALPDAPPPASATEIVPGTGGMSRRAMRLLRERQEQAVRPVPLRTPTPQSSDRTMEDVLGSVSEIDGQRPDDVSQQDEPRQDEPGQDEAGQDAPEQDAPEQDAPEQVQAAAPPLAPAGFAPTVRNDDEPRSSTPEPLRAEPSGDVDDEPRTPTSSPEPSPELDPAALSQATEADGSPDALEPLAEAAAHAEEPRRHRSTWSSPDDGSDDGSEPGDVVLDGLPVVPADVDGARTPTVFPLSLDDDTNEVPVVAESDRQSEPKPVTTAFDVPAGHWSQQSEDRHDAEVEDTSTGLRRVADRNTNALVMPTSALGDVTGALNATGEVILTGSIDLPKSLSSTGSHRPIDGAEVDRLLDQQDEQPETDASPVRASRAVSSHTSTRQVVLAAAKPKESRTPVVLAISAGAVGIAAIAVIVVALVSTNFFS